MQELDDSALLREYVERDSQDAFATLVTRHVNMVYSVALRHTRNPHQAEEITQVVFAILAQKSRQLGKRVILSGWLYQTARLTAANFLRSEIRRTRREQEAHMQVALNETEADVWPQIAPLLDSAIAGLNETDRDAVVLRFFDGKSMKEVGSALGASEDAVKMRVNRAVKRLRKFFARRGVSLGAGAVTAALSTLAVQAAPAGLAVKISTAVFAGTAFTTSSTIIAVTKTVAMTTLQKAIVATTVALLVGVGASEALLVSRLRAQNRTLQQRQSPLDEQIKELQRERDGTANRLAALADEMQTMKGNSVELLKLRNEVGQLRRQAALDKAKKKSPAEAVAKVMNDSSAIELARVQIRQTLKNRYAPLAQQMNLSPETTDKLFNLIIENELKKKVMLAQLLSGDLDIDTALQNRDAAKTELQNQIGALLGESGFAQFDQFNHDTAAGALVKGLNRELGDLALNDEQSQRIQQLFAAKPDIIFDDMDLFRSKESLDALFQTLVDRGHHDLQEAASFLTPEQVSDASTIQSNYFNTIRVQMVLGQQTVQRALQQTNR
jgi:RNA polymerase sigma factor (sigma-70 family)